MGFRFTYCGSYPKRYAWSSRSKRRQKMRQLWEEEEGQNGGIGGVVRNIGPQGGSTLSMPIQRLVRDRFHDGIIFDDEYELS